MKTKILVGLTALGLAAAFVPQAKAGGFHLSLNLPLPPLPVFVLPPPVRCAPQVVYSPQVIYTPPRPVCPPPVFVERPCYAPQPQVVVYAPPCEKPKWHGHNKHGWYR